MKLKLGSILFASVLFASLPSAKAYISDGDDYTPPSSPVPDGGSSAMLALSAAAGLAGFRFCLKKKSNKAE
jgi:hypothetical protein